jgi:hypothetical protein
MFSFGRLVMAAILGLLVYTAFYSLPSGEPGDGRFDPERVATAELEVWKAAKSQDEVSVFLNLTAQLREEHRYSWFRAVQAGFYLARATTTFAGLRGRYERVLPDLEDAAAIHRDWVHSSFDPGAVARAQLTWWVTRRLPNLNSADQVAPLIGEEYALRYRISAGAASEAAFRRSDALMLFDSGGPDPNTAAVTKILTESYRSLQRAILQSRSRP